MFYIHCTAAMVWRMASIYTQFSDTYQEANGLLYADRTPKIPLKRVAEATAGATAARSDGLEQLQATLDERESR